MKTRKKKSESLMGLRFISHLGLGFFSESLSLLTFNIIVVIVSSSFKIGSFVCFTLVMCGTR